MASAHVDHTTPSSAKAKAERVLFITRKWGPAIGGMETYCERLTQELAKDYPIDVIALKGQANGLPPSVLSLLAFPFVVIAQLFRFQTRPSIIHLGDMAIWPLALIALLFAPGAKVVLSAHGTDVSYGARGGFKGRLYNLYQSFGSRLLTKSQVIANSRATKERLLQIGWQCDVVVPLATDLSAAPAPDFDRRQLLFAGRLITQKGLSWFVGDVLPLLPTDTRLTVIGTPWDKSEEGALAHPQVEFLGRKTQEELAHHFSSAVCVIVPNIKRENGEFEGFGLVACEAASAGGLVLAADTGGLSDAVKDQETGILIEAGNAQKWAEKIAEILAQDAAERAKFLSRSQQLAQDHYSWSRVAAQTALAYSVCK